MFKLKETPNLKFLHQLFLKKGKNRNEPLREISPDSNDMLSSKATIAVIVDILKRVISDNDKFEELLGKIKKELSKNEENKILLDGLSEKIGTEKILKNKQNSKVKAHKLRVNQ